MKKLTSAYERQDLHTLLSLEIEWMNRSATDLNDYQHLAEEQLNIYNSILKEQVESLNLELTLISDQAKYFNLKMIINQSNQISLMRALKDIEEQLSCDAERYANATRDLQGKNGLKALKKILKEHSTPLDDFVFFAMDNFFAH